MPNDLESQLRMVIKEELQKVTRANSPSVYAEIHSPDGELSIPGYARMEAKIINRIVHDKIHPAVAIPQIEQELSLL